jgi:3-dehydroquinate dehydratase
MSRPKGRHAFRLVLGRGRNMYGIRERRCTGDVTIADISEALYSLRKSKGSQAVLREKRLARKRGAS